MGKTCLCLDRYCEIRSRKTLSTTKRSSQSFVLFCVAIAQHCQTSLACLLTAHPLVISPQSGPEVHRSAPGSLVCIMLARWRSSGPRGISRVPEPPSTTRRTAASRRWSAPREAAHGSPRGAGSDIVLHQEHTVSAVILSSIGLLGVSANIFLILIILVNKHLRRWEPYL